MVKNLNKAVAYLRVSGKGQVEGDGLRRQRAAIESYASRSSITIADEDWFVDEGVSGAQLDRPALIKLMQHAAESGVKLIIVERADRFARDLIVQELLAQELRDMGVNLVTSDGVDLTVGNGEPTQVLVRHVLGAIAQYQKAQLVIQLRQARERMRRQKGKCEGPKSYGHFPGEGEVVNLIFELRRKKNRATGKATSAAEITRELNRRGIKPRSADEWNYATVYAILRRGKKTLTYA